MVVVLPEPCSPTIMITAGGLTSRLSSAVSDAEHLDQGVVDDLDDHLARRDRAQHFRADRLFGDLVDEIARDRQRDVGLEQRDADLAHRRAHVGLRQRAAAAKLVEYAAEPIAQTVEHPHLPPIGPARNAKDAGGRNLAGQRAPVGATIDVVSKTTGVRG